MSTNARDTRAAATNGAIKVFEGENDRDKTSSGGSGAMFSRCCKERVCIYHERTFGNEIMRNSAMACRPLRSHVGG